MPVLSSLPPRDQVSTDAVIEHSAGGDTASLGGSVRTDEHKRSSPKGAELGVELAIAITEAADLLGLPLEVLLQLHVASKELEELLSGDGDLVVLGKSPEAESEGAREDFSHGPQVDRSPDK